MLQLITHVANNATDFCKLNKHSASEPELTNRASHDGHKLLKFRSLFAFFFPCFLKKSKNKKIICFELNKERGFIQL